MKLLQCTRRVVLGITFLAATLAWLPMLAAEEESEFQQVPLRINTALVIPGEQMVGDGYKVDAQAVNDGYSNTYTVYTHVGETQAVSDYQLARKIQEVKALQTLEAMSRAGVFGDSMKEGVLAPFRVAPRH